MGHMTHHAKTYVRPFDMALTSSVDSTEIHQDQTFWQMNTLEQAQAGMGLQIK